MSLMDWAEPTTLQPLEFLRVGIAVPGHAAFNQDTFYSKSIEICLNIQ